jgi:DNA-binding NarL/FixJ family response regulator
LRKKETIKLIEEGLTYKRIGEELNISVHAVHTHKKSISEKLQVKGHIGAIAKATRKGIL